jgi:hypothetical protein
MFTILGGDGKEYGPIRADQLRQWILEGRAGGLSQVRSEGAANWVPLHSLPEFADLFEAPPVLSPHDSSAGLPPAVRLFAYGFFIVAAISALFMLFSIVTILRVASNSTFHLGPVYFVSWGVSLLGLPIRLLCGIGLLRRQEWARKLSVIFAAVAAGMGVWGLMRTFGTLAGTAGLEVILHSPSFLISQLWGILVLVFNVATVVVLSSRPVRAAFADAKDLG